MPIRILWNNELRIAQARDEQCSLVGSLSMGFIFTHETLRE
jgi:hypothetical protein